MAAPHFVVHDKTDSVGVVVVENVEPKTEMSGWVMETDETISVTALDAIPIGHKVALLDIGKDETIFKYGHSIGKTVEKIGKGHHVHVHNLKTTKW
ncbi:MAG: UxaA family hydrolase [Alphaproteobacteria bacterium]|nr:UxaA family hydrolase [Alphaproteobacteria bacterium]